MSRYIFPPIDLTDYARQALYLALDGNVTDKDGAGVEVAEHLERGGDRFESVVEIGSSVMVMEDVTGRQRITINVNGWSFYRGWADIEAMKTSAMTAIRDNFENNLDPGVEAVMVTILDAQTYEEPLVKGRQPRRMVIRVQVHLSPRDSIIP